MNQSTSQLLLLSERHEKKLKAIATLLNKHFDLDIFWHYRLNGKGEFSNLASMPQINEYFISEQCYINHPHFTHPKFWQTGVYFQENNVDDKYQASQGKANRALNFAQYCIIIENLGNEIEGFGFASTKGLRIEESTYRIKKIALLKLFIKYYRNQYRSEINQLDEYAVDLSVALGESFYHNPHQLTQDQIITSEAEFFEEIGISRQVYNAFAQLSKRERQCLHHLAKGKTIKQIAVVLGLSPRTVEGYVNNIKIKLQCITTDQAIEIFHMLTTNI